MSDAEIGEQSAVVDPVIGLGQPQRVGRFRYSLNGQQWEWSDAVARMHGYQPGTVAPSTDLLLQHKHPDDREHVAAALDRVLRGEPLSSRHRIIDTNGHTHWVIVVGDRMLSDDGAVIGTSGFYIDVTESLQSDVSTAVTAVTESRAEIEQAKGMLMMIYRIPAERAFDLLVWRSQETNTKLRELARQFMGHVTQIDLSPNTVGQVDQILLSLGP
jgi:PAS domain S-box-containing protein